MRRGFAFVALAFIFASPAVAANMANPPPIPHFENYPALESPVADPVPPVFAPQMQSYQQELASALSVGPNFAGAYTLATLSCGPDCYGHFVYNPHDGLVTELFQTRTGVMFYPYSRMLIANPAQGSSDPGWQSRYYAWSGNALQSIPVFLGRPNE